MAEKSHRGGTIYNPQKTKHQKTWNKILTSIRGLNIFAMGFSRDGSFNCLVEL